MIRYGVALIATVLATSGAFGWNDKGHMVVARLAWKELTPDERARVLELLKTHPHSDEFLRAGRPAHVPEDEWVFLRAATRADWVRGGPPDRRKFNRPAAHYINLPLVQDADVTPPPLPMVNIVQVIKESKAKATAGGDRVERAVAVTWLFHLVGDVHQPLHCVTLYSDTFRTGDRGGNRSLIRIDGRVVQMHRFWDGLLGKSATLSSIGATVREVGDLVAEHPAALKADLESHTTPEEWAKESYEVGKRVAYLDGNLRPADADDDPQDGSIPEVSDEYPERAGEAAQYAVAKAGKRLARVLRDVLAAN